MSKLLLIKEQNYLDEMNLLKESIGYINDILHQMHMHKKSDTQSIMIGKYMTDELYLYIDAIMKNDSNSKRSAKIRLNSSIEELNKFRNQADMNNKDNEDATNS